MDLVKTVGVPTAILAWLMWWAFPRALAAHKDAIGSIGEAHKTAVSQIAKTHETTVASILDQAEKAAVRRDALQDQLTEALKDLSHELRTHRT
jgi:signal transduction histidine kinase